MPPVNFQKNVPSPLPCHYTSSKLNTPDWRQLSNTRFYSALKVFCISPPFPQKIFLSQCITSKSVVSRLELQKPPWRSFGGSVNPLCISIFHTEHLIASRFKKFLAKTKPSITLACYTKCNVTTEVRLYHHKLTVNPVSLGQIFQISSAPQSVSNKAPTEKQLKTKNCCAKYRLYKNRKK